MNWQSLLSCLLVLSTTHIVSSLQPTCETENQCHCSDNDICQDTIKDVGKPDSLPRFRDMHSAAIKKSKNARCRLRTSTKAETKSRSSGMSADDSDSVSKHGKAFQPSITRDAIKEKNEAGKNKYVYTYPALPAIELGVVGDAREIQLADGVKTSIITRSLNPPLYEIPDFLSARDCDHIIERSIKKGLTSSTEFSNKRDTVSDKNRISNRISNSVKLLADDIGTEFIEKIHQKISKLTDLPMEIVKWGERLSISKYDIGGHYYAHYDSSSVHLNIPCCFQKKCLNDEGFDFENRDCCRHCRYATILYYLNDVEEGGETAFPFADLSFDNITRKRTTDWVNLTKHCHDASVVIKPQKGKAILWYNHFIDRSNGYLGDVYRRSVHGGCDVIKGTKWIATNWISAPTYPDRDVAITKYMVSHSKRIQLYMLFPRTDPAVHSLKETYVT